MSQESRRESEKLWEVNELAIRGLSTDEEAWRRFRTARGRSRGTVAAVPPVRSEDSDS